MFRPGSTPKPRPATGMPMIIATDMIMGMMATTAMPLTT